MQTIQKRNRVHRELAETWARMTRYLGMPGQTPGEIEGFDEYKTRTRTEYRAALTRSIPELRKQIEAARIELAKPQRRIWDGGEVRCGDIIHDGTCHAIPGVRGPCAIKRRLCGPCATYDRGGEGCGEVLERHAQ
ncbi:MAG TPA: hypothetical protein VFT22_07460 [Kofleriaceae bacterium]|nr:hypothetical protein [Kofleriaceae bacterium]